MQLYKFIFVNICDFHKLLTLVFFYWESYRVLSEKFYERYNMNSTYRKNSLQCYLLQNWQRYRQGIETIVVRNIQLYAFATLVLQ